MDDFDKGWIAGIFEANGSCGVYGERAHASLVADRDVAERFRMLVGVGSVSDKGWQVGSASGVLHVCRLVDAHMGARRAEVMDAVIAWCADRIAHPRKPGPMPGMGGRRRG